MEHSDMIAGRWYITQHALERYMHLRRYDDDADEDFERAERELLELMPTARYRATDSLGRQLWRSGRPLQLRWVVSVAKRREGELPQVVWVGQARPPEKWWAPSL